MKIDNNKLTNIYSVEFTNEDSLMKYNAIKKQLYQVGEYWCFDYIIKTEEQLSEIRKDYPNATLGTLAILGFKDKNEAIDELFKFEINNGISNI